MPSVKANGVELFYRDEGEGFPVLMGHSLCLDGEMFAPQAEALKEKYRVVRIDFRGHGQSQKVDRPFTLEDYRDDVFALADALGIERFHWVGLSQGGMAGMRMALQHPGRIAGLVLMDTSADAEDPAKLAQYKGFAEMSRGAPPSEPMAQMLLQMTFFSPPFLAAHAEVAAAYKAKLLANDTESLYHATMAVISRQGIVDELSQITNPTLVMVGTADLATPPEKAREIHENLPGSELVEIPGAAHISTLEAPELVSEKLLSFFAGWEA